MAPRSPQNPIPPAAELVKRVYTIGEVGTILSLSRRSIHRLIARGDLEVIRLGRAVRIPVASIDALVEKGGC